MKHHRFVFRRIYATSLALGAALLSTAVLPASLHAQTAKKKNPSSKVYFSDVSGQAEIDTGDNVKELVKRSVYNAEGTTIQTKKAEKDEDKNKIYSTMVYSNGTGAYFDHDTRVEVKNFVQEPFTPNRTDMDVEPSISQTQAFVAHGAVGLCTSKMVAGSTMTYNTPHGGVNIRGRKVVIESDDTQTKISMLEGDSTVRGGEADLGGHTLHAGEQAVIRRGAAGQPNIVEVTRIPAAEVGALDDKVAMACMAKKTVYFEIKEHQVGSGPAAAAAGASTDAAETSADGAVTAFDSDAANSKSSASGSVSRDIVPVEVVPTNLPVQFTISPSSLITPTPATHG